MKTIKTLLLMVAITFSTVLFAGTTPKTEDPSSLTKEISELLKALISIANRRKNDTSPG